MNRSYHIPFLLIFAGYMIAHTYSWSQTEIVVMGKVVNERGTPIKDASVKLGSTDARTNPNGVFILKNTMFPAQLTVTHRLYSDYLDMVVLPEREKDTLRVFVLMTGKETQLDEVTVSAEQVFWVYPRKQANVLDFILQPDNSMLICCSDENNYFVRGLNPQGEKTAESPVRRHPRKLFRDCMETTHLIYSDSMYETVILSNSIGIFQPKPTLGLFSLLESCVYKDRETLVKFNYSKQDQCIEYFAINTLTQKSELLYIGEDRKRNRQLREYARENSSAEDELFNTTTTEDDQLKKARARWNNQRFYDLILTQPVYIPLFELNDSLIIFDHLNDSAIVFTKTGHRIRSFPIYYHYFKGWKNELVANLEKTKIYARYESDGLTTLREINPVNGKTEQSIRLEKHVFPEHLQIQGDFIYYIYKDYLDQSMHYIFKQHLK